MFIKFDKDDIEINEAITNLVKDKISLITKQEMDKIIEKDVIKLVQSKLTKRIEAIATNDYHINEIIKNILRESLNIKSFKEEMIKQCNETVINIVNEATSKLNLEGQYVINKANEKLKAYYNNIEEFIKTTPQERVEQIYENVIRKHLDEMFNKK